jgi:hypothetical protein
MTQPAIIFAVVAEKIFHLSVVAEKIFHHQDVIDVLAITTAQQMHKKHKEKYGMSQGFNLLYIR